MRLIWLASVALALALLAACGDDDGGTSATPTATADGSSSATATGRRSPTPTPTPQLVDDEGEINPAHPLFLSIASRYLSLLPPVSFTDPISCEGINEKYDEADEAEKPAIQAENIGRICILLAQSTFEDESATVVAGYFQSDAIETLNMELREGSWVIASITTPEPF